jgi:hypothetical protein
MRGWKHLARSALVAFLALLFGCAKPQRAKVSTPAPPQAQVSLPAARQAPMETKLHQAANTLEQLIADAKNAIPDAILNRTTCFAMFPAPADATASVTGFASCRNDSGAWTSPAVATLSRTTDKQLSGDLLLFFLSARARRGLLARHLDLGQTFSSGKGLLEIERPIIEPVELTRDAFAYSNDGIGLHGITLKKGSIAVDDGATTKLYGHPLDVRQLLDNSTMSSTVTSSFTIAANSFFNTITPAGIIIHHSVIIPAKELPQAERALDRFHYSRGYEISCFGKMYHIAYHYLILPDGQVRTGRPERCEGAHARGYNSYLGIALVGDFSSADNPLGKKGPRQPTKAQMESLVRLCRQLREKYNIPLQHILPHSQVSRTECPGDGLQFARILAALEQPSGAGL